MEMESTDRNFLLRWGPAIGLMGLIFIFSSLPGASIPSFEGLVEIIVKKGSHMIGFGLLAIGYLHGLGGRATKYWVLAWIFAVLYGVSDEIHQGFVAGRMSSSWDVLIDGLGALIGLLVWRYFRFRN